MIEFRNNNMEVWYEGKQLHSHYSNKVWTDSQIERSVQSFIDAKLSQPEREKIIRQGGAVKAGMDAFFDTLVVSIKQTLLSEARKHRSALSYERMVIRKEQLSIVLNGLPLTVDNEISDDESNTSVVQIPNPLREGFEAGHVMLDGLPLQIEEQLYDDQGEPTTVQMIDNPARTLAQDEYDTVVNVIANASVETISLVELRT